MRKSSASTFCAFRWMVGFSVGAKLRLVLRLKEAGHPADNSGGKNKANSRRNPALNGLRAECSNGTPQENSHFPEAGASAHPDGVTTRSATGGASRLCLGEWARCGRQPPSLHKRSWSEMESGEG